MSKYIIHYVIESRNKIIEIEDEKEMLYFVQQFLLKFNTEDSWIASISKKGEILHADEGYELVNYEELLDV